MARSQTYLVKCDRHGCKVMLEIESNTIAPEHWIKVQPEVDGKWDSNTAKEFCSAKCVGLWAKERNTFENTYPRNGNSGSTTREQLLEAISVMDGEFEYPDVMALMDNPPSNGAVGQMLREFSNEGIVKIVKQGGAGMRSVYVKGGDAN